MQSPVLKGHLFLVLSQNVSYKLNLFQEVTCLRRPHFLCPKGDLLIQVLLYCKTKELHQWCDGQSVCLECSRSCVQSPGQVKLKTMKKVSVASLLQRTVLGRKSQDWLDRNQDNVSGVERHIYPQTVVSLSQHYENSTKCVGQIQSRHLYLLTEFKLFLP